MNLRINRSQIAWPFIFATALMCSTSVSAEKPTPLVEFVNGFPMELEQKTRDAGYNELFAGGDISAYFNVRVSEFLPTAILPSRPGHMPLGSKLLPEVGKVKAEMMDSSKLGGTLTLDQFLNQAPYAQAFIVVHKGNVVYEQYPRLRQEDHHLWMSCSKPAASLVIDQLISEGKIDQNEPITKYLTDFQGTEWEGVTTRDVMDMGSGMDLEDTTESRFDPDNVARRVYESELGFENENRGQEMLRDVLKSTPKLDEPGLAFHYSSGLTQMLVLLAEAVEDDRWAQIFDRRVWSKVGAESVLQIHLTPDGIAAAHGLMSSNLRDFARFGMLYTPSWEKIAKEKVVTDEILDRIHDEVRTHEFIMAGYDGPVFADRVGVDDFIANSRQWDLVWPDGDLMKFGLMGQGLYVSPSRDLVIAYYNVSNSDLSVHRFARPIATSGLFDQ